MKSRRMCRARAARASARRAAACCTVSAHNARPARRTSRVGGAQVGSVSRGSSQQASGDDARQRDARSLHRLRQRRAHRHRRLWPRSARVIRRKCARAGRRAHDRVNRRCVTPRSVASRAAPCGRRARQRARAAARRRTTSGRPFALEACDASWEGRQRCVMCGCARNVLEAAPDGRVSSAPRDTLLGRAPGRDAIVTAHVRPKQAAGDGPRHGHGSAARRRCGCRGLLRRGGVAAGEQRQQRAAVDDGAEAQREQELALPRDWQ